MARQYESHRTHSPLAEVVRTCERTLEEQGLFGALRYLNSTTECRFTGIQRFESSWVRSVLLFDRGNPHLQIGRDVPLLDSYCRLVAEDGASYTIEDARSDPRLLRHAARGSVLSYHAVHLVDPEGHSWGTLCHLDFVPRPITEEMKEVLEAVRPVFQRALWAEVGV